MKTLLTAFLLLSFLLGYGQQDTSKWHLFDNATTTSRGLSFASGISSSRIMIMEPIKRWQERMTIVDQNGTKVGWIDSAGKLTIVDSFKVIVAMIKAFEPMGGVHPLLEPKYLPETIPSRQKDDSLSLGHFALSIDTSAAKRWTFHKGKYKGPKPTASVNQEPTWGLMEFVDGRDGYYTWGIVPKKTVKKKTSKR